MNDWDYYPELEKIPPGMPEPPVTPQGNTGADGAAQAAREPTAEMINAAAREMWNDRDARMGGPWDERGENEICVIQTKATARAALIAALAVPSAEGKSHD